MATGIGETLRTARRQQRVSLTDAAAETRVRESYLAALEEEDFAALGGDVYVKGFLRSYARFLRLDPEPLLAAYRAQHQRPPEETHLAPPMAPIPSERRPVLVVAGGVALLIVGVLAVIGLLGGDDPQDQAQLTDNPPSVTRSESEALPSTPVTPPPTASPTAGPPLTELRVAFTVADAESWMEVTVDGEQELASEQPAGTSASYEATEEIVLLIGNARAVTVTVNDQDLGELGGSGEVVEVSCRIGASACDITRF